MGKLEKYSENEIEESFGVVYVGKASLNYVGSNRIVAFRDEDTGDMMIRVEVPGMCDSPSIEEYRKNLELSSLSFNMVPDGKQIDVVLKDMVYVNEREYYAIYGEGDAPSQPDTQSLENKSGDGCTISLT